MKVLIVDDEPDIADMLAHDLREAGFEVVVEYTGYGALEHVMHGDVEAIISDIAMPDMDGCELLKRSKDMHPDIPVLLMTGFGYDPKHVLVRSCQSGIDGILYKPFEVDELIDRLQNLHKD